MPKYDGGEEEGKAKQEKQVIVSHEGSIDLAHWIASTVFYQMHCSAGNTLFFLMPDKSSPIANSIFPADSLFADFLPLSDLF